MSADGDIDVTIPGNSGSVKSAAEWMGRLRDDANTASELHNKIFVSDATGGEVAKAIASYSAPLRDASHDVYQRARGASDVMHSFAKQLKWRKDDMNEHLETARNDGLKVEGNIIKRPSEVEKPGDFPWRGTWEAQSDWNMKDAAYDEYVRKLRDFKKIQGRVQATFQELNDWIVNNLVAAKEAAIKSLHGNVIKTFTENTLGTAVADGGAYENVYHKIASDLRTTAAKLSVNRCAATSAATHSKPPSQKEIDRALKRSKASMMERVAEDIESAGDGVRKFVGKAVAIGGPIADLAMGTPAAEVAISTVAGIGAVALLPEEAAAATVITVGTVAAVGAGWAYNQMVPMKYREQINHPWEEAKHGASKAVDSATNWAQDATDSVKDAASDAWHFASGYVGRHTNWM